MIGAAPGSLVTMLPAPAEAPEYNIKAGYLRRFMRYVEWPPAVFAQASDPIVVGVLGTNPFGEVLRETLRGLKIQNHEVEVRVVQTAEEAARCHVVFIARRQERNEAAWLAALRGKPILTISESEQGMAQGAVLSLAYENTPRGYKVVFNASLPAAREAGLQLSSSLLSSAKKVFRDLAETNGGP